MTKILAKLIILIQTIQSIISQSSSLLLLQTDFYLNNYDQSNQTIYLLNSKDLVSNLNNFKLINQLDAFKIQLLSDKFDNLYLNVRLVSFDSERETHYNILVFRNDYLNYDLQINTTINLKIFKNHFNISLVNRQFTSTKNELIRLNYDNKNLRYYFNDFESNEYFELNETSGLVRLKKYPDEIKCKYWQCPFQPRLNQYSCGFTVKAYSFSSLYDLVCVFIDLTSKQVSSYKLKFNIEYIFKLNNDSMHGLIKDDMAQNGIIAIVKLTDINNLDVSKIELKLRSMDNYFEIKKFMPKFYMIRLKSLSKDLNNLIDKNDGLINFSIDAFYNQTILINQTNLIFKLVENQNLNIKFSNQEDIIQLNINKKDIELSKLNPYGGFYLTKINTYLNETIFSNTPSAARLYKNNFIRYSIINSNIHNDTFELDPINGNLIISKNSQLIEESNILLNISAIDTRKLFKTSYVIVNFTLNSEKNHILSNLVSNYFVKLTSESDLGQNVFMLNNKKHFLIFDPKLGLNKLIYEIKYVESSSSSYSEMDLFYVDIMSGKLWMSNDCLQNKLVKIFKIHILCSDLDDKLTNKLITINLELKLQDSDVVIGRYDQNYEEEEIDSLIETFYFEVDLERLKQMGQLNIGKLPIKYDLNSIRLINNKNEDETFNLAIKNDGTLILNIAVRNDLFEIKNSNFILKKLSFILKNQSIKTYFIYLKYQHDIMSEFDKNIYTFQINEDYSTFYSIRQIIKPNKKLIGSLKSNCQDFDSTSIKLSNFNDRFKLTKNNRNNLDLISIQYLDYELKQSFHFDVLAICKLNETYEYLMTTKIDIYLNDVNDNLPKFLNPITSGQIYRKLIMYQPNQTYLITQLKTIDIDLTPKYSAIKYVLFKNDINVDDPKCLPLKSSFDIDLNEQDGSLKLYTHHDLTQTDLLRCVFNLDLKVIAFNYLDEDEEQVKTKCKNTICFMNDLIAFKLEIDMRLGQNYYNIQINEEIALNDSNEIKPIRIEKLETMSLKECKINGYEIPNDKFYFNIQNNLFHLYERNSNTSKNLINKLIECKLIDNSAEIHQQYVWLKINLTLKKQSLLALNEKSKHIYLSLNDFSNNIIKIDQLFDLGFSNDDNKLIRFEINKLTYTDFVSNSFQIDRFTGRLSISNKNESFLEILKIIDLIKINILINVYEVRESYLLNIVDSFSYDLYLHIIKNEQSANHTESGLMDLYFNQLNGKIIKQKINHLNDNFKIAKIKNENDSISLIISSHYFQIMNEWLIFNATSSAKNNEIYLIGINICLNQMDNHQIYITKCKKAYFNVQIEMDIDIAEINFKKQIFYFTFYNLNNQLYFDQNLNIIKDQLKIDLKMLINHPSTKVRFNSTKLPSVFYLNELSGLIYCLNLQSFFASNSNDQFSIDIIDHPTSKSEINLNKLFISNKYITKISMKSLNTSISNNIILIEPNIAAILKLLKFQYIKIICININQISCSNMFDYNFRNDYLMINKSMALDYIGLNEFRLILIFKMENDQNIFNFEINIIIDKDIEVFDNSIQMIQFITNNSKLNDLTFNSISKIRNLMTNTQVLTLDPNDVATIEYNQIYAIDMVNQKKSFYLVKLDSTSSVIQLKKYIYLNNILDLNLTLCDIEIENNLKLFQFTVDESSSVYLQNFTLLNTIESKLNNFIKLDRDNLYFTNKNMVISTQIFGSRFNINLFKFVVDKISLKILKTIEFNILIETSINNKMFNLPFYYKNLKLTKNDLLKLNQNGYEIIIYNISDSSNDYEYQIEPVYDLPFEVDKYSGKLYYLPSEATDMNHYEFNISVTDTSLNNHELILFEVDIINDDPIVQFDNLTYEFYVNDDTQNLIGQIDISRLTHVKQNYQELEFKIIDNNTHSDLFYLEQQSGLLFFKTKVDFRTLLNGNEKFISLNVQLNGKMNYYRQIKLKITILIIMDDVKVYKLPNIEFEFNFLYNEEIKIEKFQLYNDSNINNDFKIVNQFGKDACEINQLTSDLYCSANKLIYYSCSSEIYKYNLVISSNNQNGFIQINIDKRDCSKIGSNKFYSFPESLTLNYTLESQNQPIGSIITNLYNLIEAKYKIQIDISKYRMFLLDFDNDFDSLRISNHFRIDQLDGDLILVNRNFKQHSIRLHQMIRVIDLKYINDNDYDKLTLNSTYLIDMNIYININDDLYKNENYLVPKFFYESYNFYLKEELTKNVDIKIGQIETYLYDPIEIKSFKSNQIVEFFIDKLEDSLVYINRTNGDLWLRTIRFKELFLFEYKFHVSVLNSLSTKLSNKVLVTIKIDQNYKQDTLIDYFGYSQQYPLKIEQLIQFDRVKIGDILLNIKEILFNNSINLNLKYEIESRDQLILPFILDSTNGSLTLSNKPEDNLYEFNIKISNKLKVHLILRIKKSTKMSSSQIETIMKMTNLENTIFNFKISKSCPTNGYFIGSINNFNSYNDQLKFKFLLIESTNYINDEISNYYLNETTGDLYCNIHESIENNIITLKASVYIIDTNDNNKYKFLKNLFIDLDFYNSYTLATSQVINNPTKFDLELDENTPTESKIWTMPYKVNLNFKYCSIIAGNIENRFYLEKQNGNLILINNLNYNLIKNYKLLIKCINYNEKDEESFSSEFFIQLNIKIIKQKNDNLIELLNETPIFDQYLYLIQINELDLDKYSVNTVLTKLNAFFNEGGTNNIIYKFSALPINSLVESFRSLFDLNEYNGEIRFAMNYLSKFKKLCNLYNQIDSEINIIIEINAFNEFDDSFHSSTLIKFEPICIPTISIKDTTVHQEIQYENDNNLEVAEEMIELKKLDIPILYSTIIKSTKSIKLFQLKDLIEIEDERLIQNYILITTDMHLFKLNSTNGWLFMIPDPLFVYSSQNLSYKMRINLIKKDGSSFKQIDILIKLVLISDYQNIWINIPQSLPTDSKIINLKHQFASMVNLIINSNDFFMFNRTTGVLTFTSNRSLKSPCQIDVKYLSNESDLTIAKLIINSYTENIIINETTKKLSVMKEHINLFYFNYSLLSQNELIGLLKIDNTDEFNPRITPSSNFFKFNYDNTSKYLKIFINKTLINETLYDLYKIYLPNSTFITIKLNDLIKYKLMDIVNNFNSSYNKFIQIKEQSYYSVSLYDIINFKRSSNIQFKLNLIKNSSSIEYYLNSINGLLIIKTNIIDQFEPLKFEIIAYFDSYILLRKFYLNLYFIKSNFNPSFSDNFIEIDYNYNQRGLIYRNNYLRNYNDQDKLIVDMKLFTLMSNNISNYSLIVENKNDFMPFEIDRNGKLSMKSPQHKEFRYFFNFSRLVQIALCINNSYCDICFIKINFNYVKLKQIEYLKEYNSINKFRQFNDRLKLRHFGDMDQKYSLYQIKHGLVAIDYLNGFIYTKNNLTQNFTILFDNIYEYDTNLSANIKQIEDYETKSNLLVEFYYFDNQIFNSNMNHFVGNLQMANKYVCELWKSSFQIIITKNCDLYLMAQNLTLTTNNIQIRLYHPKKQSKFYNLKIILKQIKPNNDSLITFDIKLNNQELMSNKILIDLYKYFKFKLNSYILDYKFKSANLYELTLINSKESNLSSLFKKIEKQFQITISNVKNVNNGFNKQHINIYKQLIKTNDLIVNVPEVSQPAKKIKNEIKFDKLTYYEFKKVNLSNDNYLYIKHALKLSNRVQKDENNQLIYYAILNINDNSYYINCHLFKSSIKIGQNLTYNNDDQIITNLDVDKWYNFELYLKYNQLYIELRDYDKFESISSKKIELKNMSINMNLNIDALFIGGLNKIPKKGGFYLDDVSLADFRLNNFYLFENINNNNQIEEQEECETNIWSKNCQQAFQSFKLDTSNKLQFIMKPNYENYIRLIKDNYIDDFNLDIKFMLEQNDRNNLVLLKTTQTQIIFNVIELKLEYIFNNQPKAYVKIDFITNNKQYDLNIKVSKEKRLIINNFELHSNDFDILDLFTSDLIEMPNSLSNSNSSIIVNEFYINKKRLPLYEGHSSYYDTILVSNSLKKEQKIVIINHNDKSNIITELNEEVEQENDAMSTSKLIIIISTVLVSIALLTIMAILVNVLIKTELNNDQNEDNKRNKFSSKNRLELSLNTNDSCNENVSPAHSSTSSLSFSRLTTSHSISRNTFQSSMTTPAQKNLTNYHEYDTHHNNIIDQAMSNEIITSVTTKLNGLLMRENQNILKRTENAIDCPNELLASGLMNDFELIKYKLNWFPSIKEYKSVLDEFEKFTPGHVCHKKPTINESSNNNEAKIMKESENELNKYLYEVDNQTFV